MRNKSKWWAEVRKPVSGSFAFFHLVICRLSHYLSRWFSGWLSCQIFSDPCLFSRNVCFLWLNNSTTDYPVGFRWLARRLSRWLSACYKRFIFTWWVMMLCTEGKWNLTASENQALPSTVVLPSKRVSHLFPSMLGTFRTDICYTIDIIIACGNKCVASPTPNVIAFHIHIIGKVGLNQSKFKSLCRKQRTTHFRRISFKKKPVTSTTTTLGKFTSIFEMIEVASYQPDSNLCPHRTQPKCSQKSNVSSTWCFFVWKDKKKRATPKDILQ